MSTSMCSPSLPFKFRRESSSAFTSVSIDSYHSPSNFDPSSPLPSSSPLLTPSDLTRWYGWPAGDHSDDLDTIAYIQEDAIEDSACPWSCHAHLQHPPPYTRRPLPSLMTKFAAQTHRSNASLPSSPSEFSSVPKTTYLYPHGDSAIADSGEEYDLESMDIHIRETYFATSAERGRWLSSPIAPRVRSQPIPPMHGHSSPVEPLADTPLSPERKRACSINKQASAFSLRDCDRGAQYSSSLPPSSPLSSPMSSLCFLGDGDEDGPVVYPRSNYDDCRSLDETPELNIPTTCTLPAESTCRLSPHKELVIVPLLHSKPAISPHTSCCRSPSLGPLNVHISPGTTGFASDSVLSLFSHLEMDLPVAESPKLPLSDTMNKPYPERHTTSPGVTLTSGRNADEHTYIQSLLMNSQHESLDVSLAIVSGSGDNKAKRRKSATSKSATRRTKKRTPIQSESQLANTKRRRGSGNRSSPHSGPACKRSKSSRCEDDTELPVRLLKVEQPPRLPSRRLVGCRDSESECPPDRTTRKSGDLAELRRATSDFSSTLAPVHAADAEFHTSLTGMLIEAFVSSRATSMDSVSLYLVLARTHPGLAGERSRKELLKDIATVLEAGRARCGMFEKVNSSGEKSRDKELENRWFYVAERDEDLERAALISAIMPRQKRKETKKYKQYYYQPLDKICRWDPEDAP